MFTLDYYKLVSVYMPHDDDDDGGGQGSVLYVSLIACIDCIAIFAWIACVGVKLVNRSNGRSSVSIETQPVQESITVISEVDRVATSSTVPHQPVATALSCSTPSGLAIR